MTCTKPWLITGDLNAVMSPQDRKYGAPVTYAETRDFLDCVQKLQVNELLWKDYGEPLISDHSPMLFDFRQNTQIVNAPFKFYNAWLDHSQFNTILDMGWKDRELTRN
ncbi:hypothetical protein P3S67_016355 [Capsicum chacoense]